MALSDKMGSSYQTRIGVSPREADLAVVSVDSVGTAGSLNLLVIREFGYSEEDLPTAQDLVQGFSQILEQTNKKPILFVVTVNEGSTSENLQRNLYNALVKFRKWYEGKRVWIPLMGTGAGGLTLKQSYLITTQAINKLLQDYPTEVKFIVSLPDSENGDLLFKEIDKTNGNLKGEVESVLKQLHCNFYLVGSFWGNGNDQTERFIKQSVWENGRDDGTYSSIINEVKRGDILIIKSTYASGGISYLKVKAIGVVIKNPNDGVQIKVDWIIEGLSKDIEHLGFYRNTITQVDFNDIITIFSNIDYDLWSRLLKSTSRIITNESRIAGLISDTDKGADYLDISKDITAFARVIAAKSFEPPLAIALFGKWGSGKSFFMRKLKEQVIEFSNRNTNHVYCKGVAHIHFNAWSYIDANLWASIVSRIFEGLNEYISQNSLSDTTKREIEKQLTNQLHITKEEIVNWENKKESIEQQISRLKQKRDEISKVLEDKIEEVKENTLWQTIKNIDQQFNAREKILQSFRENSSYLQTEADLRRIIPEKYWSNPDATYQQAKSAYSFLVEFFRKDKVWINLGWLIVILLIIGFLPSILDLLTIKVSQANFLIPQATLSILITAGAIWRRSEKVYDRLKPIVSSFWGIKEDYERQISEAASKFEQEEKALRLQIEKNQSEILVVNEQIRKAETIKTDLEFKIDHALATEALFSFIDKRSKSEDYRKHLGIISIIRKDLETLNGLFSEHHQELDKAQEAEEFKLKFRQPLERIILYIDDLDRCPEESVVQVLEAVNLLMAFPLFIVIVGVDSRWVKNALIKKHALQFAGHLSENENHGLEVLQASNYLEKIFQVPFHLKEAKDSNVKEMIKQLANVNYKVIPNIDNNEKPAQETLQEVIEVSHTPTYDSAVTIQANDELTISVEEIEELLVLTDEEITLMQDMSEVIGNNPRAIKRFVNIFRIVKAHEEFTYDTANRELPVILFLLALPLGIYGRLVPSFEAFIQNERNIEKPVTLYFQTLQNVSWLDTMKHQLDVILSNKQSFWIIQQTPSSTFRRHNSFIKRFTFNNMT